MRQMRQMGYEMKIARLELDRLILKQSLEKALKLLGDKDMLWETLKTIARNPDRDELKQDILDIVEMIKWTLRTVG